MHPGWFWLRVKVIVMKWCCVGLQRLYENSGKSGFGLIVWEGPFGDPAFSLQFRAVDFGVVPVGPDNIQLITAFEQAIAYCPWCGRHLTKWYKRSYDKIANGHFLLSAEWKKASQ